MVNRMGAVAVYEQVTKLGLKTTDVQFDLECLMEQGHWAGVSGYKQRFAWVVVPGGTRLFLPSVSAGEQARVAASLKSIVSLYGGKESYYWFDGQVLWPIEGGPDLILKLMGIAIEELKLLMASFKGEIKNNVAS